jgi:hypothetical protein
MDPLRYFGGAISVLCWGDTARDRDPRLDGVLEPALDEERSPLDVRDEREASPPRPSRF